MDFFAHQARAKHYTRLLLCLFVVAVVSLIALTELAIVVAFSLLSLLQLSAFLHLTLMAHLSIALVVAGCIGLAVLYKWRQLRQGGQVIAESLGGQRVFAQTRVAAEQQLVNVVEEMAVAAGLPVPIIYQLPNPRVINAFAAGFTPVNAVIGITQGALLGLSRDELQAVIAHEFSHILNGDMRLNMRLTAVLFGLECVTHAGRLVVDGSHDRGVYLGELLLLVGSIGHGFAKLIKRAINRQREYLADAAAVQFTRYPEALCRALAKVHTMGSELAQPQAGVVDHFFFGCVAKRRWGNWFSTHPTLEQRLARLGQTYQTVAANLVVTPQNAPSQTGVESSGQLLEFLQLSSLTQQTEQNSISQQNSIVPNQNVFEAATGQFNHVKPQPDWQSIAHEPYEARLLVLALVDLFTQPGSLQDKKRQFILKQDAVRVQNLREQLQALERAEQWSLLTLAIASLKALSRSQYIEFKRSLQALIQADRRIDWFEWSVFAWVTHNCEAQFIKRVEAVPQYAQMSQVLPEYAYVLTVLLQQFYPDIDQQQHRFEQVLQAIGVHDAYRYRSESWHWASFQQAINKLELTYPLLKARLIKGWMAAVAELLSSDTNRVEAHFLLAALAFGIKLPFALELLSLQKQSL